MLQHIVSVFLSGVSIQNVLWYLLNFVTVTTQNYVFPMSMRYYPAEAEYAVISVQCYPCYGITTHIHLFS